MEGHMAKLPPKTPDPAEGGTPPAPLFQAPGDVSGLDPSAIEGAPPPARTAPGKTSAAVQLADLDEIDEFINMAEYGREGTGKTTDVMFMANLGKILVINAEAGIKKRRLRQLGVNVENIRVWPDPRKGEEVSYEALDKLFWHIKGDLMSDPHSWAGIVWDSVTEIHQALLRQVVAVQYGKAVKAGKDRDAFFTDRADYGVMTEQMRLLLRRFRDLPCHFALTALERRDEDGDGKLEYGPAVTPALITDIGGFVDVLIHKIVQKGQDEDGTETEVYIGQTRPGGKYRAKDRWSATPAYMANPHFDRVAAYVREDITIDSDPVQEAAREALARKAAGVEEARSQTGGKKRAA